jgi:hypothetical protein
VTATDALDSVVDRRQPGFQLSGHLLAWRPAMGAIAVDEGELIAQADPLQMAALAGPGRNFIKVRQHDFFAHLRVLHRLILLRRIADYLYS